MNYITFTICVFHLSFFRVFTPVGKKEHGGMALSVATKALDYFAEFFGVPYRSARLCLLEPAKEIVDIFIFHSLPKMDLIALSDFAIGAMENWGLLTFRYKRSLLLIRFACSTPPFFREDMLLADKRTSSANDKQWVALIVAHEVAHQVRILLSYFFCLPVSVCPS